MKPTAARVVPLQTDKMANIACMDNIAFMHNLPDQSVQLIVTRPPYNIGKGYEKRRSLDRYLAEQAATIAECVAPEEARWQYLLAGG